MSKTAATPSLNAVSTSALSRTMALTVAARASSVIALAVADIPTSAIVFNRTNMAPSSKRSVRVTVSTVTSPMPASSSRAAELAAVAEGVSLIDDRAEVALGDRLEPGEHRDLVGRAPGGDPEPAAGGQRPAHLPRGGRAVGKELQALLAGDHVEALALGQRQVERAAVTPGDGRRHGTRHFQHAGADVHADDGPAGPDAFARQSRHDASAATDVEHPLAGGGPQAIEQHLGPRAEERADQPLLVHRRKALLVVGVGRQCHGSTPGAAASAREPAR